MSQHKNILAWLGTVSVVGMAALPDAQAQVAQQLSNQSGMAAAVAGSAVPMQRQLGALPAEALVDAKATMRAPGPVRVVNGHPGPASVPAARASREDEPGAIAPQNYGLNNLNTIYHYADYLVNGRVRNDAPYRFSGWFVFRFANGDQFRCTASLISKSIAVTAGHCVHRGGGGRANFITSGTYYPAWRDGESPVFGSASANYVVTTSGWANVGALDQGYDVGLVVLNKRSGRSTEIGTGTGWYGFCASNCLQNYWYNSQIGYPGNYYSGQRMTASEHLERSDSRDYVFGSGMQGGSSGGPHVANIGSLADSSPAPGQWAFRNIVFAATSWGYVDERLKIQGASSLSGPGNGNNFTAMWNLACTRARALHGSGSCNLL